MSKILPFALFTVLCFSCDNSPKEEAIEKWKNEIIDTEQEFAAMVKEEGIPKAFLEYAANDAVLMRNNNLVIGKTSIKDFFEKQGSSDNVSLTWKPDFVDVASSGDLGYTYGKYVYMTSDSLGNTQEFKGIFHTVWKKQPDGRWRFVWD